jgi:hypothetical protein
MDLIDIVDSREENIGGCVAFRFAPCSTIASIPKDYKNEVLHPVVFKSGYNWLVGWGIEESLNFKDEMRESPQGTFYEKSFSCIIPKAINDNEILYHLMRNDTFVLCILDSNGNWKIAGTIDEGLKFKASHTTGSNYSNLNHHAVEFYGNTIKPAHFYLVEP